MSKSGQLRARELRQLHSLLGECRDLGADPNWWRKHMVHGLCRLVGACMGMAGDAQLLGPQRTFVTGPPILAGWDDRQRRYYMEMAREDRLANDDLLHRFTQPGGKVVTRSVENIIERPSWYRSHQYQVLMRPVQADCNLVSFFTTGTGGRIASVSLFRTLGDRWFSPRELNMVHHFQLLLSDLVTKGLPMLDQAGIAHLAPRLRQTLQFLLEGNSEKEVSQRLGISPWSVHDCVKALHRHFGVVSRGELLALFLRRTGVLSQLTNGQIPPMANGPMNVTHLPPRLRQTCLCLLQGDSEKTAALHMGLSRGTVHKYIQFLYRRLGVSCRSELLALFLKPQKWP